MTSELRYHFLFNYISDTCSAGLSTIGRNRLNFVARSLSSTSISKTSKPTTETPKQSLDVQKSLRVSAETSPRPSK